MGRPARLTKAFVDQIDAPGRFSDGRGANGLSLRVRRSRNGVGITRAWEQRIQVDGKIHILGLGGYPWVGISEARQVAAENKQRVLAQRPRRTLLDDLLGDTPTAMGPRTPLKAPAPAMPTFSEVAETYFEGQCWKQGAKTENLYRSLITTYVTPSMGNLPVNQVDSSNITDVLAPIWHTKAPSAKKLRGLLRRIMRQAVGKGWIEDDPTERAVLGLGRQHHRTQNVEALPYAEVAQALEYVRGSNSYRDKKLAFEILVLMAARTSEVRGMRRGELDKKTSTWTIPARRMKAGREHRVPLSKPVRDILNTVWRKEGEDDELVFRTPGGGEIPIDGFRQLLQRRYPGISPHGFRTSFRCWAAEQTDYPTEMGAHAIAHIENSESERAYLRTDYFEKRRGLMEDWGKYVTGAST